MNSARILVVDDDRDLLHLIDVRLTAEGYEVILAESGEQALLNFREHRPQLVITDLRMGEMDGLSLFRHLQSEAPTVPVIILTAHGSIPDAVSACQQGVFSFLTKPFDGKEMLQLVGDAMRVSPVLDPTHESAQWRRNLLTASVRMDGVLRLALKISKEGCNALVIGPPGSGKTTLIQAIHQAGPRASAPFVTLAGADQLAGELEAALLPDADHGVFGKARTGVLHIKDVGALSPLAQSRLFSILFVQKQAHEPFHLPSARANPDVQVIASSLSPLDKAVAEGKFRGDLFYLLSGATLQIPALSERSEDIPLLASHFLSRISPKNRITLTPDALSALQKARWPGNVGQLNNVLQQIVALTLTASIPAELVNRVIREYDVESLPAIEDARREFERDYLVRLLQATLGNVAHAARVARRNRTEFYKLLARHGLNPAKFKQRS